MRNLQIAKVMVGISFLMITAMFSCQKDLLPEPELSVISKIDSTKKLLLTADTTKQTIYMTTDTLAIDTKSRSIKVDYLKTFSPTAGDFDYFTLSSNTTWKIESYPSWVTLSQLNGTGTVNIKVTVAANTGAQRTGQILISGNRVLHMATVNVLQLTGAAAQSTLNVNYLKTFSSVAGDNDVFTITTNTSWKISSAPSWLTVNPTSGTGTASVTVTVQANTGAQRTGSITVSGTGIATDAVINAIQVAGTAAVAAPATTTTTTTTALQANYYVAVNGSDNNPGTIDKPFATWQKAYSVMTAGQLCYIRGGTYYTTDVVSFIGRSGSAGNLIKIWAYPGEVPILTPNTSYSSTNGIKIYCDYLHLKGLEISGFKQFNGNTSLTFGIVTDLDQPANHCIFEQLNIHHNSNGGIFKGVANYFLNCDFHHNADPNTGYQNGDGMDVSRVNSTENTGSIILEGCRAWNNADDGFDTWHCDDLVTYINCWSFNNGVREDGVTIGGDGDGFKLGATSTMYLTTVKRRVQNCIAYHNMRHGFDLNTDLSIGEGIGIVEIYNNTSYQNGVNNVSWPLGYDISYNTTNAHKVRNNISFSEPHDFLFGPNTIHDHNTGDSGISVSSSDFVSLDPSSLSAPRQADGSLPVSNFLKLSPSSKLLNAGINIGLAYSGTAPSIGAN